MLHRAGLLEGDIGRFQSDAVFTNAYVLRDGAAPSAKDLVAWFEFSDVLTDCFNYAGKVLAEAGELWLAQPGQQPEDPRAAHQAGVNEVK